MTLRAPYRPGRKLPAVTLNVVLVREIDPPEGDEPIEWLLLTSLPIDTPEQVLRVITTCALRWHIEIFFRTFKHLLGCRHLLSHNQNGIEIQTYCAIIACLLISLWTGRKPTLRTHEMICYYLMGWADEATLTAHITKLQQHDAAKQR